MLARWRNSHWVSSCSLAIIVWQIRRIVGSDHPISRAVEALALSVPLYVLLFATTYFLMARANQASFGGPLSRTDAMYFSSTIFTTVGFGDITAKTEAARLVVTVQMWLDLRVLGSGGPPRGERGQVQSTAPSYLSRGSNSRRPHRPRALLLDGIARRPTPKTLWIGQVSCP